MKRIYCAICFILIFSSFVKAQKSDLLQINGTTISLLGRKIELDKNGFPKQIQLFFNDGASTDLDTANNLLVENIHFHFVRKSDGKNITFINDQVIFVNKSEKEIRWKLKSTSDSLAMKVEGNIGADGRMAYTVKITALADIALKDITMHIPMGKTAANYIKGLGRVYGLRPEKIEWKWEGPQREEIWLGNANGGLQYALRDEKSMRPITNSTFFKKPSLVPSSWHNNGRGGITIGIKGSSMLANNFTGERQMKKGDVLYYNFTILITQPIAKIK